MDWDEFQKTRRYIEEKSAALMSHEKKEYAKVGVPLENYTQYKISSRIFYSVKSNVFKHLIETFYLEAHEKFPEKFGTNNANDVIEALYKVCPVYEIPEYIEFLKNEQFAYLIETEDDKVLDKIVRIDLFRKLDTNKEGFAEFTGGIMHLLKHFSVNNLNLSTGKELHNISHPEEIIELIVRAFFVERGEYETPTKFISRIDIDKIYRLKFVFYLEIKTKVFFIKTVHKELISKRQKKNLPKGNS